MVRFAAVTALFVMAATACELATSFDRSRIGGDDDAAVMDASTFDDASSAPVGDAGAKADGAGSLDCPTSVDAGALTGWKPPQHTFGACSQTELTAIAPQLGVSPIPWSAI